MPVWLDVERGDEIGSAERNRGRVAWHVDFRDQLDALDRSVVLNCSEVGDRVGQVWAIGPFLRQVGQSRDLKRPGLRVGDVEVETVQLVVCYSIDGSFDILDAEGIPRDVEIE